MTFIEKSAKIASVQFVVFSQSKHTYETSIQINKQHMTSISEAPFMVPLRLTKILTLDIIDKFCLFEDFL